MYHGLKRLDKDVALAAYKNAAHYYRAWSTDVSFRPRLPNDLQARPIPAIISR